MAVSTSAMPRGCDGFPRIEPSDPDIGKHLDAIRGGGAGGSKVPKSLNEANQGVSIIEANQMIPVMMTIHDVSTTDRRCEENFDGDRGGTKEALDSAPPTVGIGMAGQMETRLTVVRVKRKRGDTPADSIMLEMGSRKVKRRETEALALAEGIASLDFQDRSEILSKGKRAHPPSDDVEFERRLFRRVETFPLAEIRQAGNTEAILDKIKERIRRDAVSHLQQETDRQEQKVAANSARYEQVRQNRRVRRRRFQQATIELSAEHGGDEVDVLAEMCQLYDLVRLETDEEKQRKAAIRDEEIRKAEEAAKEVQLLCKYLPLLRQYVPGAATEVDGKINETTAVDETEESSEDEYVYDVYAEAISPEMGIDDEGLYPLVQVIDDEVYNTTEGVLSDYDSEDSNDENNPGNDYPEEEEEEEEDSDGNDGRELERAMGWVTDSDGDGDDDVEGSINSDEDDDGESDEDGSGDGRYVAGSDVEKDDDEVDERWVRRR